eukprot:5543088-Alexandrium_andersonii.AAC.1
MSSLYGIAFWRARLSHRAQYGAPRHLHLFMCSHLVSGSPLLGPSWRRARQRAPRPRLPPLL